MHFQHDIPNKEIEGKEVPLPVTLYDVPGRYKYKMTELTLTNVSQSPAVVLFQDVSGANSVDKLRVVVLPNDTLQLTGFMRHFAKRIVATNLTNNTIVSVSCSGYLC